MRETLVITVSHFQPWSQALNGCVDSRIGCNLLELSWRCDDGHKEAQQTHQSPLLLEQDSNLLSTEEIFALGVSIAE